VPTNQQRREQARRQLEQQLREREQREAARKRFTLIASIVSTVVVIVVVIVVIAVVSGGSTTKKKSPAAAGAASTAAASPAASPTAAASSARAAVGPAVTFDGVTVTGATDLGGAPAVTSKASTDPTQVEYKDLVVGKGTAASPTASVSVQYVGVVYKTGVTFQSSWDSGAPVPFSLTQVVKGFTYGIGGTTGIPPMKVGGRRIVIMPAALAYGANPPAGSNIPVNAPLVFVIDLASVTAS
jgi:peptidylprolyl isomerase